ncbi:MAG: hypothetical protein IKT99_07385 [Oscillospiraceae bacterium]|nr:hypothetical protein [Oscillospiraceae bacterium]
MDALFLWLKGLFPVVWRMSLSASVLALVVLALRFALKRAPKWVRCLLWALVAVRLLCPVLPESRLSLMPREERLPVAVDAVLPAVEFETPTDHAINHASENDTVSVTTSMAPGDWLPLVWAFGVLVMLVYAAVSFLRLRRRVRASVPLEDRVLLCDEIDTPFILGMLRPRIYLPSRLDGPERAHVLAHERAHLARRDHWWKPFGFLLLSVHWFNPVLWLAYVLLCRDIELACDERVIRDLDRDSVAGYSRALLDCGVSRRRIAACPLAFGEVGVKQRVKNILNYRKPAFWIVCAALAVCIAAGVCFLTEPASKEPQEEANAVQNFPDKRPMLCMDGVYYVDPYMPISYLPEGFRFSGTLTKEQAYNTGLEGTEYYTNPEADDFYTYQLTGTPVGLNEVDSTQRKMHYLRWIRLDAEEGMGRTLTLDDVRMLAQKGDALGWDDFALYDYKVTGSGLYIRSYPIDSRYDLLVGAVRETAEPIYYLLRDKKTDTSIDIRTGDVDAFLQGAWERDAGTAEENAPEPMLIDDAFNNLLKQYNGDLSITWENASEEIAAIIRELKGDFQIEDYQVDFYDNGDGFATIDYRQIIGGFETDSIYVASIDDGKLIALTDRTKTVSEEERNRLLALTDRLGIARQTVAERTVPVRDGEGPAEPKELAEALRLALEQTQSVPEREAYQQRYCYYYEAESKTASILVFTDYYFDDTDATGVDLYTYDLD